MRATSLLAAICLVVLGGVTNVFAGDSGKSRVTVYSYVGGGVYSPYAHYSHWDRYDPDCHNPPPVVIKPYPWHPPVIVQPLPPRHDDCHRPGYSRYRSSDHGAIGIYGPRFGFSLRW